MHRISRRRAGLGAGLLLALASLAGVSPAAAKVTSSTITTPAGGFFQRNLDSPSPQTIHVAGTAKTDDNNASDAVNVICVADGSTATTLAGAVPVHADGTFSADVGYGATGPETCVMRAVDASSSAAGWANFAGPVVNLGSADTYQVASGPSTGTTYGFDVRTSQPGGGADYQSAGACGIQSSWLYTNGLGTLNGWRGPWSCDQYVPAENPLYGQYGVVVDGHNAYLPAAARQANASAAGLPAATLVQQVDPSTGVMTATDSEQLAYCKNPDDSINDGYQPGSACDHFGPAPVRLVRSYTESHAGRQVTVADQWQSTDGASHPVRIVYEEDLTYCYLQLPGQSSPSNCDHSAGEEATVPATAPATIYAYDYPDDPLQNDPSGGLTYMDRPDRIVFNGASSLVRVYNRTVPASGSLTETTVYSDGMSQAEAAALAQAAQGATSAPTLAISSPAPNAILSSPVAVVSGTASDDQPLASIKVDGITTPVAADGTWTQQVPLDPGPNTITAVATDSGGNATTVSELVYYAPSAATCAVPRVAGMPLAQARSSLTLAGCTLGPTTTATSNKVAKGVIVSQSAAAGGRISAFAPVSLVVSAGKPGKPTLITRIARVIGNRLTLRIQCPQGDGNSCSGTARIRLTTRQTIGSRGYQIPAGRLRLVTFTLSQALAAHIHRVHSAYANAYVVSRGEGGQPVTSRFSLRIRG